MEDKYKVVVILDDDDYFIVGEYTALGSATLFVTRVFDNGYVSKDGDNHCEYYPVHRIKRIRVYQVD